GGESRRLRQQGGGAGRRAAHLHALPQARGRDHARPCDPRGRDAGRAGRRDHPAGRAIVRRAGDGGTVDPAGRPGRADRHQVPRGPRARHRDLAAGVAGRPPAEPGSTIRLGSVKLAVQKDQERNMTVNGKARALRERLAKGEFILAPGIYDGISARVADKMGFPALYMTGYGATASMLGLPDAGLATYSDMVGRAEMICSVIDTPLIADADTGYGGLINVQRTVRGYEAAGVAAIQIEDQEMPKKCGHTPGRRVVPAEDMVLKIKVAAEARRDPATLIVARTDARTGHGLDEALRRAKLYEQAGADVIFVESPESEAELERIGREIDKPLLANMVEFGKTPRSEVAKLKKWGFDLAIYPGLGFSVAAEAMRQAWEYLKDRGTSNDMKVPQYRGMHELMGFSEVWDFEKKWA